MNSPTMPSVADVETHGNFVDGRQIEAGDGTLLDVRNPATGEIIARIPNSTAADIDRAMASARAAFEGKEWGGHGYPAAAPAWSTGWPMPSRPISTRCIAWRR